ncbi:MAG TPA: N-acetylmuramoyl-L-alanine amidase [Patescibacteria group bacterium]|nr:N-acetylmuramoyl-L-alanine amidase [Patescibacteria group bacterium]
MPIQNGIAQDNNIFGTPFKVDLIPVSNKTARPQIKMTPKYVTVHNTGNRAKGATAENNSEYVDNNTGYVSWHFTVDDKQIIQELPINETAWHAGDGRGQGNMTTIGVEICEYEGINWAKAKENFFKLAMFLKANVPSLNRDFLVPHQKWSGKYCPHRILDEGWSKFLIEYHTYETRPIIKEPTEEERVSALSRELAAHKIYNDVDYWTNVFLGKEPANPTFLRMAFSNVLDRIKGI